MNYEKYDHLLVSTDGLEYIFISIGPKGSIRKIIQFRGTSHPGVYNLSFGDLLSDGRVDDHVRNDNKDRNKILSTVAMAVYQFTARYPDKFVIFSGSTNERTRLYRIAITNNLEELSVDFELYGVTLTSRSFHIEPFLPGKDYSAFLIKRKNV